MSALVGIFKGVIVTKNDAFQDYIWWEFVFSNSNRGNEEFKARGCYWMVLT